MSRRRAVLAMSALLLVALAAFAGAFSDNADLRGEIPAYFVQPGASPAQLARYKAAVTGAVAGKRSIEALYPGGRGWDEVLSALNLKPTDTVADVGSGTGRLEMVLLERNVAFERLYALETDVASIQFLSWVLGASKLPRAERVKARAVRPDDLGLAKGSIDVAILLNTPIFIDDPGDPEWLRQANRAALRSIREALRDGGRLHVFERTDKLAPLGGEPCSAIARAFAPLGFKGIESRRMRLDLQGPTFRRHCWAVLERADVGAGASHTGGKGAVGAEVGAGAVEAAVLRWTDTRAAPDGEAARSALSAAIEREPTWTWLRYLDAWTARVGGDAAAEAAALAAGGPENEGWYRWFFDRSPDQTRAYLACHQIHQCLERSGEAVPAFLLRDAVARPAGTLRCGGVELEASACSGDYSLYERLTLRSRGTDRLRQWHPKGEDVRPEDLAARVGIRPGSRVADIGAGMNWFAVRFARVVGPEGRLYAVEIDPSAIPLTTFLAAFNRLPQLTGVLSVPGDITLPAGSLDVAWICDTLKVFHREDRRAGGHDIPGFLASIARALTPGGTLVVAEKPDAPGETEPVTMEELRALLAGHGLTYSTTLPDFLPGRHLMLFTR